MSEFQLFRTRFESGNYNVTGINSPYYRRVLNTLAAGNHSPMDLAALVRGALRHADETEHGHQILSVPLDNGWPSIQDWEAHGFILVGEITGKSINIQAKPWTPSWLFGYHTSPETDLFALKNRNFEASVAGDPFLKIVHHMNYRSAIQRDATRALLMAPQDSTLVVHLPTGTGKSLLFQLAAVMKSRPSGVTVVVVPTVALAIDQEESLKTVVPYPTAYYDDNARHEVNSEIRKHIREGTQAIVFTSPESVLGSMQSALRDACIAGHFKMLVIDEAHMISAWGDQFRPQFQELSGWRKSMLRVTSSGFQTVLLSATITQQSLDTIRVLFEGPGPFGVFSAARLRSEPTYWVAECADGDEKKERLRESIRHLPRPLIIYTTKVLDAIETAGMLRSAGYQRLSVVTGKTKASDREQTVRLWKKGLLDIVVATSAFGLGVDQAEVRAVIHATVPESVDRYYQEVGRGGRDGNESISLVLYTKDDIQISHRMQKVLIGSERGLERWERMFRAKLGIRGSWIQVPIDISPSIRPDDIDMDSDENISWNIRTLTLMSRSGLLEFGWEPFTIGTDELSGQESVLTDFASEQISTAGTADINPTRLTRWVRIIGDGHLSAQVWKDKVDPYRTESIKNDQRALKLMSQLIQEKRCVADILGEMYDLEVKMATEVSQAKVTRICNSCPYCRQRSHDANLPTLVHGTILRPTWSSPPSNTTVHPWFTSDGLIVFYPLSVWKERQHSSIAEGYFRRFLQWMAVQGIQQIVAPGFTLDWMRERDWFQEQMVFFTDSYSSSIQWLAIPSLYIQPPGQLLSGGLYRMMQRDKHPGRVFLLPDDIEIDEVGRRRRVRDITSFRTYDWEEFRMEVGI